MNLIRNEEKRKTKDNTVRQHHSVDRYGLGKSTEGNGQQKSTEKDDQVRSTLGLRMTEVKSCHETR